MTSQFVSGRNLVIASLLFSLFALPMFVHADDTTTSRKGKMKRNVDATCMQTAVDAREGTLATAFDTLHDALEAALAKRKTALHDAWGLEDAKDRRAALKTAWSEWKKGSKAAHKEFKADRMDAWKTFRTAAKACGESVPAEDAAGTDAKGEVTV